MTNASLLSAMREQTRTAASALGCRLSQGRVVIRLLALLAEGSLTPDVRHVKC